MKSSNLAIFLAIAASSPAFSAEPIKLSLECVVSGIKISGEKAVKQFKETFVLEKSEMLAKGKDGKAESWGFSKTDFTSDGKKYDVSTVALTQDHAVISTSNVIGLGYNRKLLVFTYIVDLQALEMERIVNAVPSGSDERTRGICKKL
jgi:hypothetical protein